MIYSRNDRILVLLEVESTCIDRPSPSSECLSLQYNKTIKIELIYCRKEFKRNNRKQFTSSYTCHVPSPRRFSCTWCTEGNSSSEPLN